jgi:hypothetical protein
MGDTGLESRRDNFGVCGHICRACAVRVRSASKPKHSRESAAVDPEAPESLSQSGILRASEALSGLLMRTAFLSGRQDLNLRPPGPQPEGRGVGQLMRAGFIGFSASVCCAVLLSLFPNLFPKHSFVCAQDESVEVLVECQREC